MKSKYNNNPISTQPGHGNAAKTIRQDIVKSEFTTMCGIVGAVAQRDIAEILLEGLRRLEYRGHDSAGMAFVDSEGHLTRLREVGKVKMLAEEAEKKTPVSRRHRYRAHTLGNAWRASGTQRTPACFRKYRRCS